MEGRLEPFQSPTGVGRGALEFYVRAFPSEEFDARVVDVQSYGDAWYTATIRLEQPDARLASGTAFEGSLVVTTEERSALCWEPVP
jgi:hypothetical protein